ncbi:MAG: hypothetical protein GWP05_02360 [Anaerolineaceae bacterium]|nr:hypothetical protein [Anaerolineaceae bacterium]
MSKSDRTGRPGRPTISPEGGSTIVLLLTVGAVFAWTMVQLLGPRVAVLAGVKSLAYFLLTTLACMLVGLGLLRRLSGLTRLERIVLGFATGQAILILLTLALGLLGAVSMVAVLPQVLLVTGLVLAWPWLRVARGGGEKVGHNTAPDSRGPADGLIVGLIVVLAAIVLWGAWSRCVEYDVLEYHAAVPAEWYRTGRIVNLPHNVYSYFPMGAEMLYLLGMSVAGSVGEGAALGKLLAGSCTVWAALVLVSVGRRLFSLRAGLVAAALYLTVPWVFRVSVIGYVEGVQSFYTAAVVLALVGLWQAGRAGKAATAYALLAGVMVGMTLSIKMTNLAFVLPAATIVCLLAVVRQRAGRWPLAMFVLAAVAFGSPFYIRNLCLADNPFFPVLSQWFGGSAGPAGWTAELGQRFAEFHSPGPYSLSALRTALLGQDLSQAHLGPWFLYSGAVLLLAPFAFLSRESRRAAAILVGLVALTVAVWFTMTHRVARLLAPVWTLLALAAGAGMTALRTRPAARWVLGAAVVLHVMMAFSVNLQMLQDRGTYLSLLADAEAPLLKDGYQFKYAPATTDDLWTYSPHMVRMINDLKPLPGHQKRALRVGLVGEARTLYFRVPVVYNTVFNRQWMEPLYGPDPDDRTAWPASLKERAGRLFSDLGLSHIYVNWIEVSRFSGPGNYGWPKWLDRELLDRLERQGAVRKLFSLGRPGKPPLHVLYEVVFP